MYEIADLFNPPYTSTFKIQKIAEKKQKKKQVHGPLKCDCWRARGLPELTYIRLTLQESLNAPPRANFRQEVALLERRYRPLCRQRKMLLQLGVCQL